MTLLLSPTNYMTTSESDDQAFDAVINRLKGQNVLPDHCFQKAIPFFNMPSLSREMQMLELFDGSCDASTCRHLLKNIVPLSEGGEYKILPQNFSPVSTMSFAQITLYKVLPCPDPHCANCPREIATHNQYKDFEYQCPFYHHERDRRRLVVSTAVGEEFVYKANYYEEGRRHGEKEKYSQNYFESMFHPLYYKMFKCKRDFCNSSPFCPFFHCEEEKKTWDDLFCSFIRKDRVSYVKDKQRAQEKKSKGYEARKKSSEEVEIASKENYTYFDGKGHLKTRKNNRAPYYQVNQAMYYGNAVDTPKLSFEKGWKKEFSAYRKDSEDSSFEEKYEGYGFFGKLQATMGY